MNKPRSIGYLLLAVLICVLSAGVGLAFNNTNYTSNATYTVGANTTLLYVQIWGTGGGGGGGAFDGGSPVGGGGGGGGAYSSSFINVTPGQTFTILYGAPGIGGARGVDGTQGYNLTFNNSTTTVKAEGGRGGIGTIYGGGGSAGLASNSVGNYIKHNGGSGGGGSNNGPGGGGGAGSVQDGTSGDTLETGKPGGIYLGGYGGAGHVYTGGQWTGSNGASFGGGGGAGVASAPGKSGGDGAPGIVSVSSYTTLDSLGFLVVNVYDIDNLSIVSTPLNVSLQGINNLVYYIKNTTSYGIVSFDNIVAGTYLLTVNGYSSNTQIVTIPASTVVSTNVYLDTAAIPIQFFVTDTLGSIGVSGATTTFSRVINNSVLVFAGASSGTNGLFNVNLKQGIVYYITTIDPTGAHSTYTGIINPVSSSVIPINNIIMNVVSYSLNISTPFYQMYTNYSGMYYNISKILNFTYEVDSSIGDLTYFGLNTSYAGIPYIQNISGSPDGGIAYINISNINLTNQSAVYVNFFFKRANYSYQNIIIPFMFIDYHAENSSIEGGVLSNNTPSSVPGKAILGMFLLVIFVALTMQYTGNPILTGFVGVILVGIFSLPQVALFPLKAGAMIFVLGIMLLFGGIISRR